MRLSGVSHLECSPRHASYDADKVQGTCRCGVPRPACYDLEAIGRDVRPSHLTIRRPALWRATSGLPGDAALATLIALLPLGMTWRTSTAGLRVHIRLDALRG
jgi:hypothetical protein